MWNCFLILIPFPCLCNIIPATKVCLAHFHPPFTFPFLFLPNHCPFHRIFTYEIIPLNAYVNGYLKSIPPNNLSITKWNWIGAGSFLLEEKPFKKRGSLFSRWGYPPRIGNGTYSGSSFVLGFLPEIPVAIDSLDRTIPLPHKHT